MQENYDMIHGMDSADLKQSPQRELMRRRWALCSTVQEGISCEPEPFYIIEEHSHQNIVNEITSYLH
jgi:hypothetical protein